MMHSLTFQTVGECGVGFKGEAGVEDVEDALIMQTRDVFAD